MSRPRSSFSKTFMTLKSLPNERRPAVLLWVDYERPGPHFGFGSGLNSRLTKVLRVRGNARVPLSNYRQRSPVYSAAISGYK